MLLRVEVVSPPTAPVVSLGEAKAHLRVLHDDEDMLIQSLIDAAVQYLDGMDGVLGRALAPRTLRAVFDAAGGDLPLAPVVSQADPVTVDGETSIEFVAGYPDGVPAPVKQAILLHVGSLYADREQSARDFRPTLAYEALLHPYRSWL